MIVIYAEKPDVGNKIAAALDRIILPGGKPVTFSALKANEKAVKSLQAKQGYLDITYLGRPCKVTWGFGHLCELKQAQDYNPAYKSWRNLPVPFIPERYELKVRGGGGEERVKAQLKLLKDLFSKAEKIINATDFDREGEVIFAYVYEYLKCKTPYARAHFTAQTQAGIQEGFARLKTSSEVKPVELAGRSRNVADWVVGANLTAQTSLKFPGNGILSVGRVQTPTLGMIVRRELEIRGFVSKPFWTVGAEFTASTGETYRGLHEKKRFDTKAEADEILRRTAGSDGTVTSVDSRVFQKETPLLYSLSALQMDANEQFGYTLSQTLDTAQWLYENGYTTYPRTKSPYLNDDMEPVVNGVLDSLAKTPEYGKYIVGKARKMNRKYFDSSKVESHFAIIPTGTVPAFLTKPQRDIFHLIALSVIRMIYPAARIEKTSVVTEANGERFLSNGAAILEPGWLLVEGKLKEEILPKLTKGQKVKGRYEEKEGKTEPPKRYTDKTIVAAMKTAGKELADEELRKILADPGIEGIGTEATRANIIQTLENRKYIERRGKQLYATDLGIRLMELFPVDDLKSAELTAKWERRLSEIARGKESSNSFLRDIEEQAGVWCREVAKIKPAPVSPSPAAPSAAVPSTAGGSGLKCPLCGGAVEKYKWGWGCANYKAGCKFSIHGEICGKKLTDGQVKALMEKGETAFLKGFKSKAGKPFEAKLKRDGDKITFVFRG